MAEILTISKADAISIYNSTGEEGKIALEDLFGNRIFKFPIIQRIKHFDDVLEELNINPDDFENEYLNGFLTIDEQAYIKLKCIVKCLNEGWTPNFKDSDEEKYWPWFYINSAGSFCANANNAPSHTSAYIGSRLCFKTRELAIFASTQFIDIYKEFIKQ
jgi:hypothetical protein